MKATSPLLTPSGEDKNPCCSKRIITLIIVVSALLLTLGLIMAFTIDWDSDDQPFVESGNNRYWQTQYLSQPSNDSCKQIASILASKPHIAGYPEQIETGKYVYDFFDNLNIEAVKKEWTDTVLDRFVSSSLRMTVDISSEEWTQLDIAEEVVESDPDTNTPFATHIWNAYSANATVVGNIVYINYGRRSDYKELISNEDFTTIASSTSFDGKIGLVRYGEMARTIKVKIAQDYGIIGLIIFSDPQQYAPGPEPVYPDGPWLPPTGVQRGSILYSSCPGNPTMDRLEALCGINEREEAFPMIPVMPLSYKNAELLFRNMLDGDSAPSSWHGDIDVDYKVDSEELVIELSVETNLTENGLTQNVYGYIEGNEYPEQIIMIGAHRDAWVYGAQDDVSGTTTMLEVAKGFAALIGRGWRPKRTMVFASWDSEESGLMGSVNFGEDMEINHLPLDDGLIAYINLDMTTGDDFVSVSGNPLLQRVTEEAMKFTPIENPRFSDVDTFYDKWTNQEDSNFGLLGSSSDHTVFAFYLGIAAMDTGFKGDRRWGAYHSIYDTIGWQEVVDPNWMLAEDIARYVGILTMKLLDTRVIPFDLEIFAKTIKEWFTKNLMDAMVNYECDPDAILDENVIQEFNTSLAEFENVAIELNRFMVELRNRTNGEDPNAADSNEDDGMNDADLVDEINDLLSDISKQFMYEQGLPERKWSKNILWETAIEDGPFNVFPYIWYALQYECDEEMLRESFDVTQNIIDDATDMLKEYVANVTSST